MKTNKSTNTKAILQSSLLIAMVVSVCFASTDTTNLTTSANINARCIFKTGGPGSHTLNFGEYDPVSVHELTADNTSGDFDVKCTRNTASQISLNGGLYSAQASGTSRAMSDGSSHYLSYEIYTSAARTTVWNTSNTVNYTDTGGSFTTLPIYGSIPAGQDANAGNYTDTVVMTITY